MSGFGVGAGHDGGALARRVFLGFGCAYFMSYAFRVVNSIVGPDLARELHFSGGDLGLLTSVYLLSFGLMQLPLGLWLDRYPAAAVNSVLLISAGAVVASRLEHAATSGEILITGDSPDRTALRSAP